MLAYLSWHRPALDVQPAAYEEALVRLHHSLAHRPPSGFRGSAAFRATGLPWLAPARGASGSSTGTDSAGAGGGARERARGTDSAGAGYEDWYLVDGWAALGVLEEAVVSRGHVSRHDAVAGMSAISCGAVYRLSEGHAALADARVGVWIEGADGRPGVQIGDLLGDGMDRRRSGLWRRCLGLGPAPEYCLLASEAPAGVADTRLPAGWRATVQARELVFGA